MEEITFVIITVSDSCYEKTAVDKSGPVLRQLIEDNYTNCAINTELVPDEQSIIEKCLLKHCTIDPQKVKLIFTTGGTGFAPRDVTPEATRNIIERECPQLCLAMSLESFKKTPFAALSRAVCGICKQTLIINLPGSPKAVKECFESIKMLLPHIVHLMSNKFELIKKEHQTIQNQIGHICPHKTGTGEINDRNSIYPMISVQKALDIIFDVIKYQFEYSSFLSNFTSPINIPPFRASIKDGYAMKSTGLSGIKKVLSTISAGDKIIFDNFADDECYKINTGAPLPEYADCVIQIEDTKLIKMKKNDEEDLVEILVQPKLNLDIRSIGCDLKKDSTLFPIIDFSDVTTKSIFASVGKQFIQSKPKIGIISTGSELVSPEYDGKEINGKIFDSNTTMLAELLKYFGFECLQKIVVTDNFQEVKTSIIDLFKITDFIICTGGVSMGDKDYIKPVLKDLDFQIHFGRVNMKPGKPMTFASKNEKYFFGLPGNPVSAFVTFHLFVLPAIRWSSGWQRNKSNLATINVTLENDKLPLDPRPEYVRAQITSRNGKLFAKVTSNQMSSRLQSICGADVLLQLPGRTDIKINVLAGDVLSALIIRYDFISKYE